MLHICNRLLLGTERVSVGAFDFHPALSFRMWLLRRAKTSKSFVRSSRLVGKRMRLVSGEFTTNWLSDTCCEQLGVPILTTTHFRLTYQTKLETISVRLYDLCISLLMDILRMIFTFSTLIIMKSFADTVSHNVSKCRLGIFCSALRYVAVLQKPRKLKSK